MRRARRSDQRGTALVLALVVVAMVSALGAALLSSSGAVLASADSMSSAQKKEVLLSSSPLTPEVPAAVSWSGMLAVHKQNVLDANQ